MATPPCIPGTERVGGRQEDHWSLLTLSQENKVENNSMLTCAHITYIHIFIIYLYETQTLKGQPIFKTKQNGLRG